MTDLSEPTVKPVSTGSVVWILPVMALLLCLWLGWQAYNQKGVEVEVIFNSGEGIEAGKTAVIYKGISIGVVRGLRLKFDSDDQQIVAATLEINKEFEDHLRQKTRFWLVKPSITLAGITGLDTLVSGNYIAIDLGDGELSRNFKALDEEPPLPDTQPGLHLSLEADTLGSVNKGSPIFYRQIQVGTVKNFHLDAAKNIVEIQIYIRPEYTSLVRKDSRFWNASGVSVDASLSGVKIRSESLSSIMAGGIAFSTPSQGEPPSPLNTVTNSTHFRLYEDYDAAQVGVQVKVVFDDYEGLQAGRTPLIYKGMQIGILKGLNINPNLKDAEAVLSVDPLIEPYLVEGTDFWLVKPSISLAGITGLEALVKGNYISMRLGKTEAPAQRVFQARPKAPPLDISSPGLHLVLIADTLGSVDMGSPVLHRQVKVGSVQSYQFSRDRQAVVIGVHIEPSYADLVNSSSRFWNASGISVSGGLSGVDVKTESLQTVLTGGIAFETPDLRAPVNQKIQRFTLYKDRAAAVKEGTQLSIHLDRGEGLGPGTPIRYRGLDVGQVDEAQLTADLRGVELKVRITKAEEHIARQGTRFRVVRPELGLLRTAHLDTLFTGPYLEVYPGRPDAPRQLQFNAIEQTEIVESSGLALTLSANRLGSIRAGNPVTFREVKVGKVTGYELGPNADRVLIRILIEPRFSSLVRTGSRFWESSGIAADFSLWEGAKIRTESLQTLVEGGIAFATPEAEAMGRQALPGQTFLLYKTPKDEWLGWSPKISISP